MRSTITYNAHISSLIFIDLFILITKHKKSHVYSFLIILYLKVKSKVIVMRILYISYFVRIYQNKI